MLLHNNMTGKCIFHNMVHIITNSAPLSLLNLFRNANNEMQISTINKREKFYVTDGRIHSCNYEKKV
jgi:hypothetical protein